jgi:hypothetical protein
MFRCFRGAIFRQFSMSLLNCCSMSLKRNGTRAVYCDRLCGGLLLVGGSWCESEAPKHVGVN